jgi:hypothetical protein
LASGIITEHLFPTDYNEEVVRGNQTSGRANGTFEDEVSILFGYSREYDQSFTVRGAYEGLTGFVDVPLFVRGFGGDFGILHIVKTATYVEINGNRGNVITCASDR